MARSIFFLLRVLLCSFAIWDGVSRYSSSTLVSMIITIGRLLERLHTKCKSKGSRARLLSSLKLQYWIMEIRLDIYQSWVRKMPSLFVLPVDLTRHTKTHLSSKFLPPRYGFPRLFFYPPYGTWSLKFFFFFILPGIFARGSGNQD